MHDLLFNFIAKYISLNEEEKNVLLSLDIFKSYKKGDFLLKEENEIVDLLGQKNASLVMRSKTY